MILNEFSYFGKGAADKITLLAEVVMKGICDEKDNQ
jgi:hypothetical protein